MGWESGRRCAEEGIRVCLWLIHIFAWQEPAQHCKVIIPPIKNKCKNRVFSNEKYSRKTRDLTKSTYIFFKVLITESTNRKFLFYYKRTIIGPVMNHD